jgi:hypothetical protein
MVWLGEIRFSLSAMSDIKRFRVLRADAKPRAAGPQPLVALAWRAESSYRRRNNLEVESFMSFLRPALRILPAALIAALLCLGAPGAWAQTATSGASSTASSGTETAAQKKKDAKAAKEAEESKEKAAKEAEAAKEKSAKEEKGTAAPAGAAPAGAAAGTTTAAMGSSGAMSPMSMKPAASTKTASTKSASGFSSEAEAKASCPMDTVVWENTSSKVYHAANSKYFGKTKKGAYACSKAAAAAGFKAASN